MRKILFFLFLILIIYSCTLSKKTTKIPLNQNKLSGFFVEKSDGFKFSFYNDTTKLFYIDTIPVIKFSDFDIAKKEKSDYSGYNVYLKINEKHKEKLQKITSEQIGNYIFIIINDNLVSAPIIQQEITEGEVVLSGISEELVDEIINIVKNK